MSATENIFSSFFSSKRLTKEYPLSAAAKNVRVNGLIGMRNMVDTATWHLKIAVENGDTMNLKFSELTQLPKTEVIFDFKCVEGWSQVTHWGGIRFSDFISHYHLELLAKNYKYVGFLSVDKGYYVGIDIASMMQPQTLLCYEMNDAILPMKQGYPLRLIIPVKYGIKHIKQIGTIYFSNTKPKDYWAERGYDYFAGL